MKEYALYKGEECLIIGTIEEIAKHQGILKKSVIHLLTPSYINRCKKSPKNNYKVLIRLEE